MTDIVEETKLKDLESYFKKAKSDKIEFKGFCHDCNKPVNVKADVLEDSSIQIKGGAVYLPHDSEDFFCKCEECFKKNQVLENYRKCDVYSRVVGFYRPIKTWNDGKQSEWKKRQDYSLPEQHQMG